MVDTPTIGHHSEQWSTMVNNGKNGKMSLVDLAGSERLKSTNSKGKVLQEAGFINKSLYILQLI